jgi:hypothetical protein
VRVPFDVRINPGTPRMGASGSLSPSEKDAVFNKKHAVQKGGGLPIAACFPDHFTDPPRQARPPAYSYALWLFGTIAKGGPISV